MARTEARRSRGDGDTPRPRSPLPPPGGGQGVGVRRFIGESWAELRKVQWPSRQSVAQGTLVVGLFTLFFALFLTVVDFLAVKLVDEIDKLLM